MATVRHPTLGAVRTVHDAAAWVEQGWLPADEPVDTAPADEPVMNPTPPAPWWQRRKSTPRTKP